MNLPEIKDRQLREVCLIGHGPQTCRYVVVGTRFECAKLTPLRRTIDARVNSMNAKGDNCLGLVPSHVPLTGKSGIWMEDGDQFPVTILTDNTDAVALRLRVRIDRGEDQGREFDASCAWEAVDFGRQHLWRFVLPDGKVIP